MASIADYSMAQQVRIGQGGVATDGFAITPHDSTNLTNLARGVYVGGAGNVALVTPSDTVLTFVAIAGGFIPFAAKRINSTGTTATGLIGAL